MCGIFGILSLNGKPVTKEALLTGARQLEHRGPDTQTIWLNEKQTVGLAHARLSIIDLSVEGNQPFSTADGVTQSVTNGELYNFETLKTSLKSKGYTFKSQNDCEVIPYLYDDCHTALFSRLDGMFATAIWDGEQLTLGRDPYGKKPLFYLHHAGEYLVFASEVKPLIQWTQQILHAGSFVTYLMAGYILGKNTIFSGIQEVPAGSYLTFNPTTEKLDTEQYWHWPEAKMSSVVPKSDAEWIKTFQRTFFSAVEKRLLSDVPVGAFLSGGIDSSAVVAAMAELRPHTERHTFSIQFEEQSYDTSDHIATLVKQFNLQHHRITFRPADFVAWFEPVMAINEGLLADISLLPMHKLAAEAGKTLKVVLTGDGADELLGGYDTYKATAWAQKMSVLRQPVGQLLQQLSSRVTVSHERKKLNRSVLMQQMGYGLSQSSLAMAHAHWRQIFSTQDIEQDLLSNEAIHWLGHCGETVDDRQFYEPFWDSTSGDWLKKAQAMDIATWMRYSILPKVDRSTMAYGLEARSPFLDLALGALCATLPTRLKTRHPKWLLRKAIEPYLPKAVVWQKKSGFNTPLSRWLIEDEGVRSLAEYWLLSDKALSHNLFSKNTVETLWNTHQKQDCHLKLWNIMVFNAWHYYHLSNAQKQDSVSQCLQGI